MAKDENGNPIKNSKGTHLPEHCLGQLKNPEIQAKAQATRAANAEKRRKQREVLETGFGKSKLSDPNVQATLLDMLTDLALSGDQKSMKMLIEMNAIKMPSLKPEDETTAESLKDLMAPDAAMAILKENAKKEK